MKLRLRLEIEKTRAAATLEERSRLALEELELARIATIQRLLRRICLVSNRWRPVLIRLTMVAEEEAEALANESF